MNHADGLIRKNNSIKQLTGCAVTKTFTHVCLDFGQIVWMNTPIKRFRIVINWLQSVAEYSLHFLGISNAGMDEIPIP
ncbi:hypothetical protein D3C73_616600 [compost metagenome]